MVEGIFHGRILYVDSSARRRRHAEFDEEAFHDFQRIMRNTYRGVAFQSDVASFAAARA